MLPALPRIPACGLNGTDTRGPAAFESNAPGESSDPCENFSATLNRISERRYGSQPKATPAEKPQATSPGSNTDSASTQKMSKNTISSNNYIEENQAPVSKETPEAIKPLQTFGLMPAYLMNVSIAEDGSLAAGPPSGLTTESDLSLLAALITNRHPQELLVEDEQLGIGPFEQLQFSISADENYRALLDQLVFGDVPQRDGEGLSGNAARLFEFWQGMFLSASTAPDGALNGQPESSGINGNATLNPLLQMLGMGTTGAAWGINPDAGSSDSSAKAAGQEGTHINAALLDRLLTPSQSVQTEVSENSKMAVAGQSNAEALLEAQIRQMSENSQPLKIQAALKPAVEQPANPNSANEGITVKTPEEVFGIKSALQKSALLPVHELGNKISQIDGDSKDSGFLFSQDQLPQHLAKLENGAQPSEAAARSLMPQTLDQIVQKAALSLHNGQHEVQLHLKPDFLGHIRMQIISEGQQVAIKMVAELPFVKDMLENNLQQLKAELQAQGLDIDELEVSVAHDSHAERDVHQNAGAAKPQTLKNGTDSDDGFSEQSEQTQSWDGGPMAETAIDYFA
jgi:flagellar hook-length control protein FliK